MGSLLFILCWACIRHIHGHLLTSINLFNKFVVFWGEVKIKMRRTRQRITITEYFFYFCGLYATESITIIHVKVDVKVYYLIETLYTNPCQVRCLWTFYNSYFVLLILSDIIIFCINVYGFDINICCQYSFLLQTAFTRLTCFIIIINARRASSILFQTYFIVKKKTFSHFPIKQKC